jgi:hypothetical protein
VLALSRDNAWAVGVPRTVGVANPRAVIEHWDGRAWTRVPLPSTRRSSLNALAAFGAADVWAGGGSARPILLHWDGSRWRKAPAPAIAAPILGLAAARDGTLWAVGQGFVAYSRCR